MTDLEIPFNKPYLCGGELAYIAEAHAGGQLAGDGVFTQRCHALLEEMTGSSKVLLTHSCTAALEIAALLADVGPGDEIIMPSYTFVSTANAFVLRGATPVFVDIRPDTLNIDEQKIEAAITKHTKAIVPVHYAGVACEMDVIMDIAERYDLLVIEDAAQGVMSNYKGRALGSIGHLGTYSFHETKNIISGEGGALLINDPTMIERAEILREKGTNRSQFFRGEIDKYTWVDVGSSYLPGEIVAAFLLAQLEASYDITQARLSIWKTYQGALNQLQVAGLLDLPTVPEMDAHNGAMFYLIVSSPQVRDDCLRFLRAAGIGAVFHYVPLHSSTFGQKYCRTSGVLSTTSDMADRIIRLPFWIGIEPLQQRVSSAVISFYQGIDETGAFTGSGQ